MDTSQEARRDSSIRENNEILKEIVSVFKCKKNIFQVQKLKIKLD